MSDNYNKILLPSAPTGSYYVYHPVVVLMTLPLADWLNWMPARGHYYTVYYNLVDVLITTELMRRIDASNPTIYSIIEIISKRTTLLHEGPFVTCLIQLSHFCSW